MLAHQAWEAELERRFGDPRQHGELEAFWYRQEILKHNGQDDLARIERFEYLATAIEGVLFSMYGAGGLRVSPVPSSRPAVTLRYNPPSYAIPPGGIRLLTPRGGVAPRARIPQSLVPELRGGGSWLMTEEQYVRNAKGVEMIGSPDGQFMTTARQMNLLIHETGGNPVLMGERLGISSWGPDTRLIRMDVTDPLMFNPRSPLSTMTGANSLFRPGGFTSGDIPELVTDQLPWYQVWATPMRR